VVENVYHGGVYDKMSMSPSQTGTLWRKSYMLGDGVVKFSRGLRSMVALLLLHGPNLEFKLELVSSCSYEAWLPHTIACAAIHGASAYPYYRIAQQHTICI
jgi:hypothetical protein